MTGEGLFGGLLAWTGLAGPANAIATPDAEVSPGAERPPPVVSVAQKPFVPPPWPFDTPPPERQPEAPDPVSAPVPFIPTPLPFAPTWSDRSPAPDFRTPAPDFRGPALVPRAPAPVPRPPAPVSRAATPRTGPSLARAAARLLGSDAPPPFVMPPWALDPRSETEASPSQARAPVPFIPTPLPFAPTRNTFPDEVEPAFALPTPVRRRARVGQMHAEATARAARFVAANAAATARRTGNDDAASPAGASWGVLSPKATAVMKAAATFGGPAPAPAPIAPSTPAAHARAEAIERALAQGRAKLEQDRQSKPKPTSLDSGQAGLGVALACILILEVFGGVVAFALGSGYLVLAFGLALDACARTLGTVAAARTGQGFGAGWPWACALIGSPAVVAFAFYDDGSLVDSDLAPLAGPMSALAIICVVIGLAGIPAGI